jgi:hypothetical protein
MANADFNEMLEVVGKFNEELIRAGVLLAAEGLADPAEGVVADFSAEPPVVTDAAVRRDQGTVRRVLHHQRGVEGGGRRVQLLADGALPGSHLLPSVRGELLARLGRYGEARAELARAVDLCGSEPERTVLRRKIAGIADRA